MNLKQLDEIITGCWAIFLRHPNGLKYFTVNSSQFIWSFGMIVIVCFVQYYLSPIELVILSQLPEAAETVEPNMPLQMLVLIINWFVWPFVAYGICKLMAITEHYMRYMIVNNWSRFVTLGLILTPSLLFQFGLPIGIARMAIFASTILMLIYKWRIAKISLATTGLNASIILFIDIAATIIVATAASKLFIG